jgi:hypothetical protein
MDEGRHTPHRPGEPREKATMSSSETRRDVVLRLLIHLRRANRSVIRLRAVALAARDGHRRQLLAALARLRRTDLRPRRSGKPARCMS